MPDLLTRKPRKLRPPRLETPPRASQPKELFVAAHRMASRRYLIANLSRAVLQTVSQSEDSPKSHDRDTNDFGEILGAWLRDATAPDHDVGLEDAEFARTFRNQLERRFLEVVRDAQSAGDTEQARSLLEKWLVSLRKELAKPRSDGFLDQARRLDEQGQTDAALDIIFDQIDEMLLAREFERVDQLLAETVPSALSLDLLLGLLTVTLPARNRLKNRPTFSVRVEQTLRERGEFKDGLLIGLE